MANAPICHIPPNVNPPSQSPNAIPSIPPAQPNLASLTATVNALRQVIMIISGQQGAPGAQGAQGKAAPAGSWTQQSISSSKVKIYQNNDPTTGNFVEVDRVDKLVFGNDATKQTWTYNRTPDPQ